MTQWNKGNSTFISLINQKVLENWIPLFYISKFCYFLCLLFILKYFLLSFRHWPCMLFSKHAFVWFLFVFSEWDKGNVFVKLPRNTRSKWAYHMSCPSGCLFTCLLISLKDSSTRVGLRWGSWLGCGVEVTLLIT